MKKVFLSIGSNRGDKKKNLARALRYLNVSVGQMIDLSGIYETDPWGFESNEKFLNMVVEILTHLKPEDVLKKCLDIELKLGRVRTNQKGYTSRIIDIDILFYGEEIIKEPDLVVPHPLLHSRRFVLEPLAEVAPDMIHPNFGMSIKELLLECKDTTNVIQTGAMPNE